MKRKSLITFLIVTATASLTGCFGSGQGLKVPKPEVFEDIEDIDDIEDGGVADSSDPDAKKTIKSDDLVSFSLTTEIMHERVALEGADTAVAVYPGGVYTFTVEEKDGKASVHADFSEESYDLEMDGSVLARLNDLIRDNDIASFNGFSKRDSALGTHIDLQADYADGETIRVYGEGGASCIPYGWRDDIFIGFFDGLIKESTGHSFAETLVEDDSVPLAKDVSPDEITEIYLAFSPDYALSSTADEFPFGDYRLQYVSGGIRAYEGVDKNMALWFDNGLETQFDASDEDMKKIMGFLTDAGLFAANGWNRTSRVDSGMDLELSFYGEGDELLHVEAHGADAMPAKWDPVAFLKLLKEIEGGK